MKVHDLAVDWAWMDTARGFRIGNGKAEWQRAEYVGAMQRLRISRITKNARAVVRFVHGSESVTLLHGATP